VVGCVWILMGVSVDDEGHDCTWIDVSGCGRMCIDD
jgi:hypothetical protein